MTDTLAELIAQKLLDNVDQKSLEQMYYDVQLDWADALDDDERVQVARDLGIEWPSVEDVSVGEMIKDEQI